MQVNDQTSIKATKNNQEITEMSAQPKKTQAKVESN